MSLIVCVSVCVSAALRIVSARRAAAACRIILGGEGNALYPVFSVEIVVFSSCMCARSLSDLIERIFIFVPTIK